MQITLSNSNLVALIDDEDTGKVGAWSWWLEQKGDLQYARTRIMGNLIFMHRVILPSEDRLLTVDHRNGNGLDNRKENLRFATALQQSQNVSKRQGYTTSKFKGVSLKKQTGKYQANIRVNSKLVHLGYFEDEKQAAITYNLAAMKHFGEFAKLNEL